MINTILGIGIKFGICYIVIALAIIALIAVKVQYEKNGIKGAIKEFFSICLSIIVFISAAICIILAAVLLINGAIMLTAKTGTQFNAETFGIFYIFAFFFLVGTICFFVIKKFLIEENKTEIANIEDEKLLYITEQEEENIKDLVGGWYYWDRMDNHTKNKYIREYRIK